MISSPEQMTLAKGSRLRDRASDALDLLMGIRRDLLPAPEAARLREARCRLSRALYDECECDRNDGGCVFEARDRAGRL